MPNSRGPQVLELQGGRAEGGVAEGVGAEGGVAEGGTWIFAEPFCFTDTPEQNVLLL